VQTSAAATSSKEAIDADIALEQQAYVLIIYFAPTLL